MSYLDKMDSSAVSAVGPILVRKMPTHVREWFAQHSNTKPETLEQLANDEEQSVRFFVAQNPNTKPEALRQLANDEEYIVRLFVAQNPNTERAVVTQIVSDPLFDAFVIMNKPLLKQLDALLTE